MRPFFLFFLVSGACSLIYEVVWVRLAMAMFGTTTPSISTVLSVFMAGLALGSWGAGRLSRWLAGSAPSRFMRLYAGAELLIGLSALIVPAQLDFGRRLLVTLGRNTAWEDAAFLFASGAAVAVTLLPYAVAMGATFPLAMAAWQRGSDDESTRSFGYLYAANVLGATAGVILCAFVLIELLGFRRTLLVTALANAGLAVVAWALATKLRPGQKRKGAAAKEAPRASPDRGRGALALLFTTGFVSMAMEVVWVRMLTPYLGPVVYTFAAILALYLAATFAGSWAWRFRSVGADAGSAGPVWLTAGVVSLAVLAAADPRIPLQVGIVPGTIRAAIAIAPFCAVVGWLTPRLVDLASRGDPQLAGRAYAANVVGCILGPLAAGFVLLPSLGERGSMLALAAPLLAAGIALEAKRVRTLASPLRLIATAAVLLGLAVAFVFGSRGFETLYPGAVVRRDYEATVIAAGDGLRKQLLVNGMGITSLTPITKMMVHFPLVLSPNRPKDALVICFGMGTSFRSAMSWGIPVTSVELVPSVPGLFGYYHGDGPALLRSPRARVVIDDGRRFLERTREQWDLIVVDPPPPIDAAGSSLLYSKEFCALARARLRKGGIFQQWLPEGDPQVHTAVARAISESFPHVRVFQSVEGWGLHFLASENPIATGTPEELAARLPHAARDDLMEWWPGYPPAVPLARVVGREVALGELLTFSPETPALSDDLPVNEYCVLRRLLGRGRFPNGG